MIAKTKLLVALKQISDVVMAASLIQRILSGQIKHDALPTYALSPEPLVAEAAKLTYAGQMSCYPSRIQKIKKDASEVQSKLKIITAEVGLDLDINIAESQDKLQALLKDAEDTVTTLALLAENVLQMLEEQHTEPEQEPEQAPHVIEIHGDRRG